MCVYVYVSRIHDWKNWIGFEVGSWLVGRKRGEGKEKRKRKEKARREKCGKLAERREVFEEPKRVSLRNEHNIGLRYRWMHFGLAIRCPTQRYKEFVYPV